MNKRIIFATTDYSYFTQPVIQSLQQIGLKAQIFDYNKPNLLSRLVGLTDNLLGAKNLPPLINRDLLQAASQFKPNYFLVIKGEIISAPTIRQLNRKGIITVNWYPDWLDSWPWLKTHASAYAYFFNCCLNANHRCLRHGINSFYLPFAAPDYSWSKTSIKKYPITFVGQHTPRREKYFTAIKDLGLHIWGYSDWQHSSLKSIASGPLSVAKIHQIIRQSKIVVNLLTGTDKFQPNAVNVRTFETLGAGSFLLVKDHPILQRHFKVGKELITFTTPQDLRRKVKYYLNHDQQRAKIAQAGYNRILKDHTFVKRLQELFKIVDQHVKNL